MFNTNKTKGEVLAALRGPDTEVEEAPEPDRGAAVAQEIAEAFRQREEELPGIRSELRARYQDQEIYELLVELSERGIGLRCNSDGEEKLWARPRKNLTPELAAGIRRHKVQIVRAMQDMAFVRTGKIQCARQVFEIKQEVVGA